MLSNTTTPEPTTAPQSTTTSELKPSIINDVIEQLKSIKEGIESLKKRHNEEITLLKLKIKDRALSQNLINNTVVEAMTLLQTSIQEQTHYQTLANKTLLEAIREEKIDVMKFALKGGANIEKCDKKGETPLFYCFQNKKFTSAEFLLSRGANLEAKNKKGETILYQMCEKNDEVAVSFILKRSSKANEKADNFLSILAKSPVLENKGTETKLTETQKMIATAALFQGVKQGTLELVKQALEQGADINAQDESSGETPLHTACRFKQINVLKFLISKYPKKSLQLHNVYNELPDDLTMDIEIKKILSDYRKEDANAVLIQSHVRGIFARQLSKKYADEYKKALREECQSYISDQFSKGNFTNINSLMNLLNSKYLHQSEGEIRKIINKSEAVGEVKRNLIK